MRYRRSKTDQANHPPTGNRLGEPLWRLATRPLAAALLILLLLPFLTPLCAEDGSCPMATMRQAMEASHGGLGAGEHGDGNEHCASGPSFTSECCCDLIAETTLAPTLLLAEAASNLAATNEGTAPQQLVLPQACPPPAPPLSSQRDRLSLFCTLLI